MSILEKYRFEEAVSMSTAVKICRVTVINGINILAKFPEEIPHRRIDACSLLFRHAEHIFEKYT